MKQLVLSQFWQLFQFLRDWVKIQVNKWNEKKHWNDSSIAYWIVENHWSMQMFCLMVDKWDGYI